jgi:hypothetical protein
MRERFEQQRPITALTPPYSDFDAHPTSVGYRVGPTAHYAQE